MTPRGKDRVEWTLMGVFRSMKILSIGKKCYFDCLTFHTKYKKFAMMREMDRVCDFRVK